VGSTNKINNMNKRGFTLVEIMIVVAIIALLAAIAIPNLLRARLQANESAAQAALKTVAAAEVTYRIANSGYADLALLGSPATGPAYIDGVLAAGTKNGYVFSVTDNISGEIFQVSATPISVNISGFRSFCITEDGVVRVNNTGAVSDSHDTCLTWSATGP